MLDKLESLKIFCTAAETLKFRETANQLGISPQLVTRAIAELEKKLGEMLFVRNTRQMKLTSFGQQSQSSRDRRKRAYYTPAAV